ncbi:unnamed protein product [Trifolium pratense]|uniref:Uncharacterized protein n=1 Tax=Trifolium pratense TaxID=57577 RepID=A0ACB0LH78_TRIPR|nr:unnamed protein product [Trifolium pratense]
MIVSEDIKFDVLRGLTNSLLAAKKPDERRVFLQIHQLATFGNRKKASWIFPKTRVQPNGNDCGYYVMKNMIDIVSASITKNWMEVFNDPTALTEEVLYDLRDR